MLLFFIHWKSFSGWIIHYLGHEILYRQTEELVTLWFYVHWLVPFSFSKLKTKKKVKSFLLPLKILEVKTRLSFGWTTTLKFTVRVMVNVIKLFLHLQVENQRDLSIRSKGFKLGFSLNWHFVLRDIKSLYQSVSLRVFIVGHVL